jgi:quinol monooxygenase YgiN
MVIIAGHVLVEEAERDDHVKAHSDLVSRCRAFDGCIVVAITADSVDPRRVNILEIWRDAETLDSWRGRANAPETGVEPIEMQVQRYDATDGGPLF